MAKFSLILLVIIFMVSCTQDNDVCITVEDSLPFLEIKNSLDNPSVEDIIVLKDASERLYPYLLFEDSAFMLNVANPDSLRISPSLFAAIKKFLHNTNENIKTGDSIGGVYMSFFELSKNDKTPLIRFRENLSRKDPRKDKRDIRI